ncbi:hypothetical protein [Micromonospora echinospora]
MKIAPPRYPLLAEAIGLRQMVVFGPDEGDEVMAYLHGVDRPARQAGGQPELLG